MMGRIVGQRPPRRNGELRRFGRPAPQSGHAFARL
jgi:hypothetical protein